MTERCVHIVEDDALLRRSLSRLIQAEGFETKSFTSSLAFLDMASRLPPRGCLLLDIRMPDMDGLELQAKMIEKGINLPIVMMTGQADVPTAVRAMKGGAVDFIEKPLDDNQVLGAIKAALGLPTSQSRIGEAKAAAAIIALLSPRENDVLRGLVAGLQNKLIAAHLGISVRTVEGHRIRMLERLGVKRLAEAIRLAVLASLSGDKEQ
jgi:two-component system response regulator FixJ